MANMTKISGFHNVQDLAVVYEASPTVLQMCTFTYTFENFFHPLLRQLIKQLNQTSVAGMLDPGFLNNIADPDSSGFGPTTITYRSRRRPR
jgi:hypothetical protein